MVPIAVVSNWGDLAPQGTLAMCEDSFGYPSLWGFATGI